MTHQGVIIQPTGTFQVIWIGWVVSWAAASLWSGRTEKRDTTYETWIYRAIICAGAILIAPWTAQVMGEKPTWQVGDYGAYAFVGVMVLGLAYRSGTPWNESSYANPEFDKLLTEAEGILEVDRRRVVMAKLEQLLQQDGPIIQPLWRIVQTGYDRKVKGFHMHPTQYIFLDELAVEKA